MKFRTIAIICAFLACASIGNAGLVHEISVDTASIQNAVVGWAEAEGDVENYTMIITGSQSQSPGTVLASFTEAPDDPNIWVYNGFENDTTFAWTEYHIVVKMDHPFDLSNAAVDSPGGWTAIPVAVTSAVYDGSYWYVGIIDYNAGTPVPMGGVLDFHYKISFVGYSSTNYSQELYPIPEPGTLVLLVCGVLGLLAVRRRFA
jgi:hypothetical protein